ncbi:MAG: hypothetical protein U0X73_01870 [Thermoanaerobaculia bacterium]
MRLVRDAARGFRLLARQGPVAFARMLAHQSRRAVTRRFPRHAFLKIRPPVGDLLGMTTPEEQSWLYDFARRSYRGEGEIADLGCWFGSSTIPLAQGLAENPAVAEKRGRIHAFDLFLWETWMEDTLAGTGLAGRLAPGSSFLPQFEQRIAPWRELVTIHAGDLNVVGWPFGQPLALVFNDASKTLELGNSIRRDFVPCLIPGSGILVEQDFAHFFTPWVHLSHWRLREYFAPVLHVPYSGSMVFRLERAIPAAMLTPLAFEDFDEAEIDAAFERSLGLVERPMRPNVWAARAMLELHRGRPAAARGLLEAGGRRGFHGLDLDKVRAELAAASVAAAS